MQKIFISGITGFVGSNLEPYLESHYSIKGVGRKGTADNRIIPYSLLDQQELNSGEAFVHLAGKAHDLKKTSSEKEYFEVNTELTKKVFKQFLNSKCRTFIYLSSVKAVADTVEGSLSEQATPTPLTAYGKSKLEAERYLLKQSLPANKRLYILRPCMIHGPGNKGNLNLLFNIIQKGIPWPLGSFRNERSFLGIDNLLYVIRELFDGNLESGIYNVADDQSLSTNELIKVMAASQGKDPKIWYIPSTWIKAFAKVGDNLSLPLNEERLGKLTESYVVSNQKIKNAFGIQSMPSTTIEGLDKTFKSFKK